MTRAPIHMAYRLTLEDVRESVAPARRPKRWVRATYWAIVAATAVSFLREQPTFRWDPPRPSANFTANVTSGIAAVLYFLVLIIAARRAQRNPDYVEGVGPLSRNQQLSTQVAGLAATFLVFAATWSATAITWHPTTGQAAVIGIVPWLFFFGVLSWMGADSGLHAASVAVAQGRLTDQPFETAVGDSGICIRTESAEYVCKWAAIRRFRETQNLIVLMTTGGHRFVLPRRATDGPGWLQLLALIADNVADGSFVAKPIGFPVGGADFPPSPPTADRVEPGVPQSEMR